MEATQPTIKSRLRKVRTVELRFFEDQATAEWGLAHKETFDQSNGFGDGFNAFWDGRGLFHDIFEHAHEFVHKYFRGDAAFNIGGEVAAMGALWYYHEHGMYNRLRTGSFYGPDTQTMESTCGLMEEAIWDARTEFGNTFESRVPRQRPTDDSTLEWIISEHWKRIKACIPGKSVHESEKDRVLVHCREYKNSVTFRKLADLYRYGYRMAERLFKDYGENGNIAAEFMEYWNTFCKANPAEELAKIYRGITFTLYRDSEKLIHWKAEFNPDRSIPDVERVVLRGGPDGVPPYVHVMP